MIPSSCWWWNLSLFIVIVIVIRILTSIILLSLMFVLAILVDRTRSLLSLYSFRLLLLLFKRLLFFVSNFKFDLIKADFNIFIVYNNRLFWLFRCITLDSQCSFLSRAFLLHMICFLLLHSHHLFWVWIAVRSIKIGRAWSSSCSSRLVLVALTFINDVAVALIGVFLLTRPINIAFLITALSTFIFHMVTAQSCFLLGLGRHVPA